jgi:hypothetical protein
MILIHNYLIIIFFNTKLIIYYKKSRNLKYFSKVKIIHVDNSSLNKKIYSHKFNDSVKIILDSIYHKNN